MKKSVCAVLVGVMVAVSLCGCGAQKKELNSEADISFSVYQPMFSKSADGTDVQKKWTEMMEEYTGKKLDITWNEVALSEYTQKQQVYLAAGDYSDVFVCFGKDETIELGNFGQIVDIKDYDLPYYTEYLNEDGKRVTTAEGSIFGFADATISANTGTQYTHVARFDILEKHNITPPGTLSEYYEAAKKLKELYPDSYPLTSFGDSEWLIKTFLAINRTSLSLYYNGEKYVYPVIDESSKVRETVEFLQKMYSEGLLDPEFLTQNSDQSMQKMLTGKTFFVPAFMGIRINQYINNSKDYNVKWGVIPEPKNDKGEIPWKLSSNIKGKRLNPWANIVISAKAENPELLAKIIDYQYSDEMTELANFGIEGVTFNRTENGYEYTENIINTEENPQLVLAKYGVNQSMSVRSGIQFMPQNTDAAIKLLSPVPVYANGKYYEDNFWKFTSEIYGEDSICPDDDAPVVSLTADETSKFATDKTSLDTFVKENILKFITGENDMSEWDSFVKRISTVADYKKMTDTYNAKIR